jgi:hypothetical protein
MSPAPMPAWRVRVWLTAAWWCVMPPFAALAGRLAFERACAAPYELLPAVSSVPAAAAALAGLYVAAHAVLAAGWLVTAIHADALAPAPRTVRAIWGPQTWMLVATLAVFVVEYAPVHVLRLLGRHVGGCLP